MRLNVEVTINETKAQEIKASMIAGTMTKGAAIRECFAGGMDVRDISKVLDIRYNHVYNVVKNEVIVHGLEVEQSVRGGENSKKAQILAALAEGKTITQIATEQKCLYNYVWQIAKGAGYTGKKEEAPVAEPVVENTKKERKAKAV